MRNVKGLILCGGPGKRLRPITYYFQKTMVPVGSKQKPQLEYVVRLLAFHGIKDLVFLVNYKAEQIKNYFQNGARFNVKISYIGDDPASKGTAGAVLNTYRQKAVNTEDTLLVYYGDILTNMNISDLLRYHKEHAAWATLALASGFQVRVGVADLKADGRIREFMEKPRLEKPVSVGVIALKGATLKEIALLKKERSEIDLMGEVIPSFIRDNKPVYGYVSDAFWYDVVSTEAYEKLSPELVDQKFEEVLSNPTGSI